jgi:hypothetical protein
MAPDAALFSQKQRQVVGPPAGELTLAEGGEDSAACGWTRPSTAL